MSQKKEGSRQARFMASLSERGIKPVNVLAPVEVHETIKEIARRTRDGESLEAVLASFIKPEPVAPKRAALPELAVPDHLTPGPGEMALAIRLGGNASGSVKRAIHRLRLTKSAEVAAWVGVVPLEEGRLLMTKVEAGHGAAASKVSLDTV